MADFFRYFPALLPAAAIGLFVVALRPEAGDVLAPVRLAILRGGVAVGAIAICGVELLSALDRIDGPSITTFWVVVDLAGAGLVVRRGRLGVRSRPREREPRPRLEEPGSRPRLEEPGPDPRFREREPRPRVGLRLRKRWSQLRGSERAMLVAIGGLVVAELVLALASAPNNYDSNYYHLPKIEHWVADHDVDVFPTPQLQLVTFVPGTEYLLLHLRLLTGNDGIYNLVQWLAGIGAVIAVSRIAAQLGAGRLGQWIAAALVAGTPMVVLEATSTQTDLACSAWLLCAASFAVDGLVRRARTADLLSLGAAGGLVAVTKSTGLMGLAAVLLLWGVGQLRLDLRGAGRPPLRFALYEAGPPRHHAGPPRSRLRRLSITIGSPLVVVAVALLIVGPFMIRMERTFGSPLGSQDYNDGLQMERHDPPALLVNALRMVTSTLVVPLPAVNTAVADGVIRLSRDLGVDPFGQDITVGVHTYPDPRWWPDEDHSPYPIPSTLMLLAVGASLLARRVPGVVRAYAGAVLVDLLLTVWVLKWQLWGNRLLLVQLLLGLPLAAWWLGRLCTGPRRPRRSIMRGAVAVIVAVGLFWGYDAVLLGRPRRLVGHGSVFAQTRWQQRFARQPDMLPAYRAAADLVRATGAHRVGTVVQADQWEYPLWLMLPGRELVASASVVPGYPAASPSSVGAIVCVADESACRPYTPDGWTYTQVGGLMSVMLPPARYK